MGENETIETICSLNFKIAQQLESGASTAKRGSGRSKLNAFTKHLSVKNFTASSRLNVFESCKQSIHP